MPECASVTAADAPACAWCVWPNCWPREAQDRLINDLDYYLSGGEGPSYVDYPDAPCAGCPESKAVERGVTAPQPEEVPPTNREEER